MIGRADALRRLQGLVARSGTKSARRGAVVLGVDGVGKSRLLQEGASTQPGVWVCRARRGDELVPYSSLARWMHELARHAALAADREAVDALHGWLGHGPTAVGRTLESPPDRARLLNMLGRAEPSLAAWCIDDLHLADEASCEWWLGLLLATDTQGPRWVLSSQAPKPGTMAEVLLEAAAAMQGVEVLRLEPLQAQDIFDGLLAAGPPGLRPTQAHAWAVCLAQATGGLPLHLQLLARGWAARPASLPAEVPSPDDLPAVLRLVGDRLAELPPAALRAARAAAVIGPQVCVDGLAALCALTRPEIERALSTLEETGLWAEGDFGHEQLREAARLATPEAQATRWHLLWAQWLERHGGEPAHVAAHWQAAGEPLRALPGLDLAAQQAGRLGRTAQRLACLVQAARIAELHGQDDRAFNACCEAFASHASALRTTEGPVLLAQMERLARTAHQQAQLHIHRSWYAWVHGQLPAAIESGERALALAQSLGDMDLGDAARQTLGSALAVDGQLRRARALLQATLPWVERELAPDEQASSHGNLAAVLDNLGLPDDARFHHRQALARATAAADPAQRVTLLANYAQSRLDAGDALGAQELAGLAHKLMRATPRQTHPAGFVALLQAGSERALGRYAAAAEACDRAELELSTQTPARLPLASLERANLFLDMGQPERALALLDGAGRLLAQALPPRHAVRWLLLLARVRARTGLDAGDALNEARRRLPEDGWPWLALQVRAEESLAKPGGEAAASLSRIAQEAADAGWAATALGAWLQAALLAAAGARQGPLAVHAAEAAMVLMDKGIEAAHVDRALRWLAPAHALRLDGQVQRAAQVQQRGRAWLTQTAASQLPPAARHSFLELHPLNLALAEGLTAAA